MRRIVCILFAVLGSAAFMHAQSSAAPTSTPGTTCTGTVCLSSCVVQVDNTPTCDPGCTDNRGVAELIDDRGRSCKSPIRTSAGLTWENM